MLRRHGRNTTAPAGLAALVPLPSLTRLRSAPLGNPLSPQSISARCLQRRECRAHGPERYSPTIAGAQIYRENGQPFERDNSTRKHLLLSAIFFTPLPGGGGPPP